MRCFGGKLVFERKMAILFAVFFIFYMGMWFYTIHVAAEQMAENPKNEMILPIIGSDSLEYKILGQNIFDNHQFAMDPVRGYETFRTPGYPFFIGLLYDGNFLDTI
jgi:hypothetical protein